MGFFPSPFDQDRRSRSGAAADFVIINGRRVPVGAGLSGRDIADAAGAGNGRRAVKVGAGFAETVDPSRWYSPDELRGRNGRPVKFSSMPDRTKGAGVRSNYSRAIIAEQVFDVARSYVKGNVNFDEDNADWMVIPDFRLPRGWNAAAAPMMILFPQDYPSCPPIGFYLPNTLRSPNGHFFGTAYHGADAAPTLRGWNWYCCTVNPGSWRPYPARASGEWKRGDNLWTYVTLINEVLAS